MEVIIGCGSSVAAETGNTFLAKIKTHIGYLFHYDNNMKGLDDSRVKLNAKIKDGNQFAKDTNNRLMKLSSTANHWRSEADKLFQKAQIIIPENNRRRLFPNLWSRYSSSKNACELTQEINEVLRTAPEFGTSFHHPSSKHGDKFDLKGFMEFESRKSVVNEVWEALKDEKVRICSICGMGGAGKTMLAKKLIQRVESNHLFDMVGIVTVSQNAESKKIRDDIMCSLGWKSESKDLAHCLLNNNERILLILDDVWEVLNFEEIGLLLEARLKIVLTSRNVGVCQRMGSEPNFIINVLTNDEPWVLFKERAGESIVNLKVQDTARKIAEECGGLPIVIEALATALKYEVKATWNVTLLQLQKSNVLGISELEKVYSRIRPSYDLLNKEAQACFRLCCLFPEDHNVTVEDLVFCGKGLQLFENVESIKHARERVESIIDKLKRSFLLLDGDNDSCVKMHDTLRDFAISISSKDAHPYIVGCEKVMQNWPETGQYENCSAISFVCDKIKEYPLDFKCPKLELLQLSTSNCVDRLPVGFFEGLKELKVLVLHVMLPSQSLAMLKNLRTLVIISGEEKPPPKIGDLLGHGDMKYLEIFEFGMGYPYDDFPKEIGLLCNLRRLKLYMDFDYMPPGVLSKLVKLEELELPWGFISWGCKDRRGDRVNASLDEIESLPLTTLKISVPNSSTLTKELVNKLTRFNVFTGSTSARRSAYFYDSNAALDVSDVDATTNWIRALLSKCECFTLREVRNLKNMMCLQSVQGNGFPQLKYIYLESCSEMEYLVDTITERISPTFFSELRRLELRYMHSLKSICPNFATIEATWPCFSNLTEIRIKKCSKLKNLFPLSMARELRQLQSLHIGYCPEMEEIFYRDEALDDENQVASSNLQLSTPTVEASTSAATISNSSTSVASIVDDKSHLDSPTSNSCFPCLRGREKQSTMVSSPQIVETNIPEVEAGEAEIDHVKMDAIIFLQLKSIDLVHLDNLRVLYDGNHTIELPSLEDLRIVRCKNIEALFYGSIKAPRLEHVNVNNYMCRVGEDLNATVKKYMKYN